MKEKIKAILNKFGLQLIRIHGQSREIELTRELEGLYREILFRDFPGFDNRRTRLLSRLNINIGEAYHILDCLYKSLKLEGDVCEFGVAKGRTSALLAYEIIATDKNLWLFDSFQGLSKPSEKDKLKNDIFNLGSIEKYEGSMACKIELVKNELKIINFPSSRVKIIPGFIEKTIKSVRLPEKVCFAYVDLDLYEPILTTLNFLNNVLQKKGFIVIDDYDFFSTGVKTAVEEFAAEHEKDYSVLLPVHKSIRKFCILKKIPRLV